MIFDHQKCPLFCSENLSKGGGGLNGVPSTWRDGPVAPLDDHGQVFPLMLRLSEQRGWRSKGSSDQLPFQVP